MADQQPNGTSENHDATLAAAANDSSAGGAETNQTVESTPANPNCTVYVRNLNQRIPLPMLKQTLGSIFAQYGPVLDVKARGSIRMRGQAFIVYRDLASAERALKMNGFPLFNQQIQVEYARQKSLAIARMDGTAEELKRERAEGESEREEKFQQLAKKAKENASDGPPRPRQAAFMPPFPMPGMPPVPPGMMPPPIPPPPGMMMPPHLAGQQPAQPAQPQIPDEMLPPNKILFIQNIPKDTEHTVLVEQFKRFPGFKESRPVPGRPDMMFIEYETEFLSAPVKDMLNGKPVIPGNDALIKVTFARK